LISPRSRPLTERAIRFALIMGVALSACQTLHSLTFFHSKPAPVPAAQPTVAPVSPTATPMPTPVAHAADTHKHRKHPKHKTEEAAAPTPTATSGEDQPPVLSLAPPADSAQQQATKQRAQNAMDDATRKLATVDRSGLEGQKATDYDLASGFIKDAQDALRENDFAKAESLAEKAAVLAGLLANAGAVGR
jgi:uncharacterized protein (DUF885 family)